ncbi:MAG: RNA methyltransferase [Bacteroidia bacterium]|nr:MAG: RNA methyltransferase [Bacteroidia bacterium]
MKTKEIKLFPNLAKSISEILFSVFSEGKKADKVIEYQFKNHRQWGSRDRATIAEISYEIIRHWRWLWYLNQKEIQLSTKNLFQIIGTYLHWKGEFIPEWLNYEPVQPVARENLSLAIAESYPDDFFRLVYQELGEQWLLEAHVLNIPAKVVLRVNTLKISKTDLQKLLLQQNIETVFLEDYPNALLLQSKLNIFQNEYFQKGFFEIQDANSQKVAEFCEVAAGMRVIDACAGAGGKSLHLAALMKNKGRVLAMDIEEYKLKELNKRKIRAGADNIEIRKIEKNTIKRFKHSADRVLLDVPCSGTGVLRRNPDAKWKIDATFIQENQKKQQFILNNYCEMTKIGGKLIYSTCSILPSENEKQIENFLSQHSNFELEEQKTLYPSKTGFDGFFMARMVRKY